MEDEDDEIVTSRTPRPEDLGRIVEAQEALLRRAFHWMRDADLILKAAKADHPVDELLGEIAIEIPDLQEGL